MTSLLALFTGVGLTADRLAVIFNGGTARTQLIAALLCAAASVALGLSAVIFKKLWLAVVAVVALFVSLVLGVFATTLAFSDGGRPTLTKVSVVSEGDTHAQPCRSPLRPMVSRRTTCCGRSPSWVPVI